MVKSQLAGGGAYCGGLPHSLFFKLSFKQDTQWRENVYRSTTPGRGVVDPGSFYLIFDHAPCPGQKILEINIEAVCDSYPSCFALTQTVRAHRESLRRVIQNRFQSGPKSIDPGNLVEICLQLFLVISSQTRTDERTVTIA